MNVGRGEAANDLALQLAYQNGFGVVLIQKPWIGSNLNQQISKKHNAYQAYAPEENWTERSGIMTYARRHLPRIILEKSQDLLALSTDILVLELYVERSGKSIYVVNIYNAPAGCTKVGETIASIIESTALIQKSTIWAGDLNLHHVDWDSHTINPTPEARSFAEWVTDIGGRYALPQGTVTHQ